MKTVTTVGGAEVIVGGKLARLIYDHSRTKKTFDGLLNVVNIPTLTGHEIAPLDVEISSKITSAHYKKRLLIKEDGANHLYLKALKVRLNHFEIFFPTSASSHPDAVR